MKNIFLCDLDDTLLDFQRAERENFIYTMQSFGVCADGKMLSRYHEINEGLWKSLERGEIERERLKVRRFELLFEEFGLSGEISAVAHAYVAHFPSVCFPFAGAEEFLRELRARGQVFLVTNGGRAIQTQHILLAGFSPYLNGVFISEEIGANKPALAFANHVEAQIEGYRRENAVWIGDSLSSDGACARARGIDFLQFFPEQEPKGQYQKLLQTIDRL